MNSDLQIIKVLQINWQLNIVLHNQKKKSQVQSDNGNEKKSLTKQIFNRSNTVTKPTTGYKESETGMKQILRS